MVARFSGCAVITHWLPHTLVHIFFRQILVHKKFWCSLSYKLEFWLRLSEELYCLVPMPTKFCVEKRDYKGQGMKVNVHVKAHLQSFCELVQCSNVPVLFFLFSP